MKTTLITAATLIILGLLLYGCSAEVQPPQAGNNATPAPPPNNSQAISLPALDALFGDKLFTDALKAKVQLSDEEIARIKKLSSDEMAKLRAPNAENQTNAAEEARARVLKSIRDLVGSEKTDQVIALALERQSSQPESATAKVDELTML